MRIAFITTIIFPSRSANRVHTLAMAKAFGREGVTVDFLCQSIQNCGLGENVKLIQLGTKKSLGSAFKYSKTLQEKKYHFWYCREPHLLLFTLLFTWCVKFKKTPRIVYEIHDMPRDFLDSLAIKVLKTFCDYEIVVITRSLARDLADDYDLPEEKILVLPDGVDLEKFQKKHSREEARSILSIPEEKKVVVYTGNLFAWKGVYTLLEAAKLSTDALFVVVGGSEKEIIDYKKAARDVVNVSVVGYVEHEEVPKYLMAADVLVLPNSATYKMSHSYTSPLKLFEYMAMNKPIVASSLPSIQEILEDEKNAYLVSPDDERSLAEGIRKAMTDPQKETIAENAYQDVKGYSWQKRAETIIERVV